MPVARIGVSLEGPLLRAFDRLVEREGYGSRSKALQDLIRKSLAREEWVSGGNVVGTITIVYRHAVGEVAHRVLHRQHEFVDVIRATAHTHLEKEVCLEVLIVEGGTRKIAALFDQLKTARGVLFAESSMATKDLI